MHSTLIKAAILNRCLPTYQSASVVGNKGSVYRASTRPQSNYLKDPGKNLMMQSVCCAQRSWENNFPTVLPTFFQHPKPKTWLNPKDHRPCA